MASTVKSHSRSVLRTVGSVASRGSSEASVTVERSVTHVVAVSQESSSSSGANRAATQRDSEGRAWCRSRGRGVAQRSRASFHETGRRVHRHVTASSCSSKSSASTRSSSVVDQEDAEEGVTDCDDGGDDCDDSDDAAAARDDGGPVAPAPKHTRAIPRYQARVGEGQRAVSPRGSSLRSLIFRSDPIRSERGLLSSRVGLVLPR